MSAPPRSGAPLIDCHAHVWGADTPFAPDAWKRPDYIHSVERYLAELDAHGVRYAVLSAASLFGTHSAYALQALRAHRRLRATAIVEPDIGARALAGLHAEGIVGIRLQWFFLRSLPDMQGNEFRQLCHAMRDLGMHFHLNIDGARLVEVVDQLQRTGVKLVIDHFGWHDPALRLEAPSYRGLLALIERGNVWVKMTSAFRHPDDHAPDWTLPIAYAQDLLHRFGTDKLFWGSDAPFIGHETVASYALAIERLNLCVPDPAQRRAIGENGYRFYFGESQ